MNIFESLSKYWVFVVATDELKARLSTDAKNDLSESKASIELYKCIDWDKDDSLDF